MGARKSKIVNPTANVINEVEVGTNVPDLMLIETLLIVIAVISTLNFVFKVYAMHSRKLKKKYQSRATDLDKI